MLDNRPAPKQRSLLELLRYLTVMGPALVPSVKAGTFLVDEWNARENAAKTQDFDSVAASLAALSDFYARTISEFTDDELRAELKMFGQTMPRGPWLVTLILSGHAAYRMQLFLYLKSCGREELNTMNLWAGVDAV